MQRQKTIAKWIAVLLALTLAGSGYIIFGTLYKANRDSILDSANGSTKPADDEKHQPFYSVFPRNPEQFEKTSVNHVGGEGEDTLVKVIVDGVTTFCFFETTSVEYDVKSSGIYLAVFNKNTLKSVKKITDKDEKIVTAVMRENNIVALTNGGDCSTLYSFTTEGALACKNEKLPLIERAELRMLEGELYLFHTSDNALIMYTVEGNLDINKSNFSYELPNAEIKYIIPQNGGFGLVISDKNDNLQIVLYTHKSGFNVQFALDKVEFVQFASIQAKDPYYVILAKNTAKDAKEVKLVSLNLEFERLYETSIPNAENAAILVDETELRVVTNTHIYHFCDHLDTFGEQELPTPIEGHLTALTNPKTNFIMSENNGKMSVASIDYNGNISEVYKADNVVGEPVATVSFAKLYLAFTSRNNTDNLHMNFGKSDIFLSETTL